MKCDECENWKQRGDELFDQNDTLNGANESLRDELARHLEIIDELREQLAAKEIKNDDKV